MKCIKTQIETKLRKSEMHYNTNKGEITLIKAIKRESQMRNNANKGVKRDSQLRNNANKSVITPK